MSDRYGKTRISKIKAAYVDLRASVRAGDNAAAQKALDRYEPWADFIFDISARENAEALQAEIDRLREVVRFYANNENWKRHQAAPSLPCHAVLDSGKRARAALQEGK